LNFEELLENDNGDMKMIDQAKFNRRCTCFWSLQPESQPEFVGQYELEVQHVCSYQGRSLKR
jgi:hypothetical protein